MQALIDVLNMFCDSVLETAKSDRGLGLTQLVEVIFDLVHMSPREASKKFVKSASGKRNQRSLQDLTILIIQLHAAGLIFVVHSMICRHAV
jgi:hypothetical protein